MAPALLVYLTGVVIALLGSDAPLATRAVLAALWPVGVVAFVVTVTILLAASLIAFPTIGLTIAAVAAAVAAWTLFG
jgi:hypothetical protein